MAVNRCIECKVEWVPNPQKRGVCLECGSSAGPTMVQDDSGAALSAEEDE